MSTLFSFLVLIIFQGLFAQELRLRNLLGMAGLPEELREDRLIYLAHFDRQLSPQLRRERAGGDIECAAHDRDIEELYLDSLPIFFEEGAFAVKNIILVSVSYSL